VENNPYAPSSSSLQGASRQALEDSELGFRDLSGLTALLSTLLLIGAGLHILSTLSLLLSSSPLEALGEEAGSKYAAQRLIGVVEPLLLLIIWPTFCRWIYLAHQNLPALGARNLRITSGWAIGTFFVPVLNLWVPYQAMQDLAKASRSPGQWRLEPASVRVVLWWILWLVVEIVLNALIRLQSWASVPDLQTLIALHLLSEVLSVPLYFLAHHIVLRVWRDQAKNHMELGNASVA
jgi:hypothetical protein